MVLIECKGTANADSVDQLSRYGKTYGAARLILVAFSILSEARRRAAGNSRIELVECDLKFKRLT